MSNTKNPGAFDLERIGEMESELRDAAPSEIARSIGELFGDQAVATVSMQNPVLAHLLTKHAPQVELVFIDTGYHFGPTLSYLDDMERLLGRTIRVVEPLAVVDDDQWRRDPTACCAARKVEPLHRILTGKQAWISGVRRADSEGRARAKVVELDVAKGVVKVNPLLNLTDAGFDSYVQMNRLPVHPLTRLDYGSIGCWPCTTPVKLGEHKRDGRWRGAAKTECGLHAVYETHPNV